MDCCEDGDDDGYAHRAGAMPSQSRRPFRVFSGHTRNFFFGLIGETPGAAQLTAVERLSCFVGA